MHTWGIYIFLFPSFALHCILMVKKFKTRDFSKYADIVRREICSHFLYKETLKNSNLNSQNLNLKQLNIWIAKVWNVTLSLGKWRSKLKTSKLIAFLSSLPLWEVENFRITHLHIYPKIFPCVYFCFFFFLSVCYFQISLVHS